MKKETKIYNANDENLNNVRKSIENMTKAEDGGKEVFTMQQRNAPCTVTITKDSRQICAKSLTELR